MISQPIQHTHVETNGVRLHVAVAGPEDGPLLVLLHGFPELWYAWRRQIEYFAARGYRVLAPDQRGYNLSDKPPAIADYRIDTLADDVAGLIRWAGRAKAFVVGHDWGAAVAWWTALRHPALVEKLVILNVPHPLVMRKNLTRNPRQIRKSWYIFFFQLPWLPERFLARDRLRPLEAGLLGSSRPGTFTPEELVEYRKAWSRPGAIRSMVNWYRASLQAPPERITDPVIAAPTLILWGERDKFLGVEMAEQSLRFCRQGSLVRVAEASHWIQHEEAARVNAEIAGFLGSGGNPART